MEDRLQWKAQAKSVDSDWSESAGTPIHCTEPELISAENCACRGEVRESLHHLRAALRQAPRNAKLLVRAANVFLQLGYNEKALRVLRSAERCASSHALQVVIEQVKFNARQPDVGNSAWCTDSALTRFPVETMLRVFAYLDLPSLHAAIGVCQKWRKWGCAHGPLWHTIRIGRDTPSHSHDRGRDTLSHSHDKERVKRQLALLSLYLRRGKQYVRHVTLGTPVADSEACRRHMKSVSLHSLSVTCYYTYAQTWVDVAIKMSTLCALTINTTGAKTHPWLAPPLRLDHCQCRPLKLLALHGTPPLHIDPPTLRLCVRLEHFSYSAPTCAAALREVRRRCAVPIQTIVHAAQDTLQELLLDGDAIWGVDTFLETPSIPQFGQARFPHLHRLQAPLKCMVLHALPDVALSTLMPNLHTLSLQVSLPRTPGGTSAALLQFASAVGPTTRHATLRITRDSSTWLVKALLQVWTQLTSLKIVWDDPVSMETPMLESVHDTMQRPLTGALLVRILTPGAFDPHDTILCPALESLQFGNEASIRGREIAELVAIRVMLAQCCSVATARDALQRKKLASEPDLQWPLATRFTTLDLSGCRELQPDLLPFLKQHCHVVWSAELAEQARHALRPSVSARDRLSTHYR
ncbi:hypothetical protein MYAM1_002813 [Malassezia yamatoensis]|uniref:F-box domain-containing protein n=1 Tax=Malassezia yamatoensis TaxID=253288 RepID=A0AAJ5YUP0_9BASI|nr:hypothetical protein MYAM1_002813 [Malassezia yamatoensis]